MAPLDDSKVARTNGKRVVTIASRRLQSGMEMEMVSVSDMAKSLDLAYCDFVQVATEYQELCDEQQADGTYTTVNRLKLDQYEAQVKRVYRDAISSYRTYTARLVTQPVMPQPVVRPVPSTPVYLKKRDIPKLSGNRKDWPEFKAVWEKLVVQALPDKIALAVELKQACKEGSAYQEIFTIVATSSDAYQNMWDSLCQHFDNVTLSVASALDEVNDFRHTREEDYEGVVKLIRQVESIYQQLQVLDQVKLVSNREVNLMMSYFPPLMRKEWAEHHFKLDVAQQLTPFESCHKFLCEKIKIAKHMADTEHFLKSQKQNVTKCHKPVAKSAFTTNVKQQSVLKCCVHESGGHSTAVCRQFAALSVQERRD